MGEQCWVGLAWGGSDPANAVLCTPLYAVKSDYYTDLLCCFTLSTNQV
jgi:hypothetical protein